MHERRGILPEHRDIRHPSIDLTVAAASAASLSELLTVSKDGSLRYWNSWGRLFETALGFHEHGPSADFDEGALANSALQIEMLGTLHARLAGARAFARAESRQANWSQAEMLRVMGERDREHDSARQSPDAAAQAEMLFKRALTIARQQGARSWELRAATSLAMLWRDAERPREAQKLLREVYGWFKEGRATNDLVRAKALLADLSTRL